jgi:hypothetical protein
MHLCSRGPILSPCLGDEAAMAMASGWRTGHSAYIAWRAGTTAQPTIAGFIHQSGTKNTVIVLSDEKEHAPPLF